MVKIFLQAYGFIILTEIKTSLKISCTGFTVFQNSAKQGHRGGIALLIKPGIAKFIKKLDKSYENIISFELEFMTDIVFVGCYITPGDSPYYDAAIFGYIQSLIKKDEIKTFFIMGDLNSRVGVPVDLCFDEEKLTYNGCEDITVNGNGRNILQLCGDTKLAVVNNLKYGEKHFKSQLSFRKKSRWISEPDLLLTSKTNRNVQHVAILRRQMSLL